MVVLDIERTDKMLRRSLWQTAWQTRRIPLPGVVSFRFQRGSCNDDEQFRLNLKSLHLRLQPSSC